MIEKLRIVLVDEELVATFFWIVGNFTMITCEKGKIINRFGRMFISSKSPCIVCIAMSLEALLLVAKVVVYLRGTHRMNK